MKKIESLKPSRWAAAFCLQMGAASLLLLGMGGAHAQSAAAVGKPAESLVSVALTQLKVSKGADGKEQFSDAGNIKPGDVIEYRAVYTNRSDKPVNGVVATIPCLRAWNICRRVQNLKPACKSPPRMAFLRQSP